MIGSDLRHQYSTTAKKFVQPQELEHLRVAHQGGDQVCLGSGNDHLSHAATLVRAIVQQPAVGTYKTLLHPTSGAPAYYVFGVESRQAGRLNREQVVIKSDYSQAFLYQDR
jgi:hypothetical protein